MQLISSGGEAIYTFYYLSLEDLNISTIQFLVLDALSNISGVMNAVKTYKNARSRIQRKEFTWSRFIETAASATAFMD